jgi:hypothetical protein
MSILIVISLLVWFLGQMLTVFGVYRGWFLSLLGSVLLGLVVATPGQPLGDTWAALLLGAAWGGTLLDAWRIVRGRGRRGRLIGERNADE